MTSDGTRGLSTALAALVSADLDVADVLVHLVADCAEATGADAVAVLARDGSGSVALLTATSHRVAELEMLQSQRLSGPCIDAMTTRERVAASGSAELVRRWGDIGTAIVAAGYESIHAYPMAWRGEVIAGLNLFAAKPFVPDRAALARAYADVATLAIVQTVAVSHEQVHARLREALEARELVEQAKGVLAYTEDLEMDAAYDRLVALRDHDGRPLTQVASEVLRRRGAPDSDD